MPCNCAHLIVNTSKTIQQGVTVQQSNFLCALKRASKEDTTIINDAFRKKTLVSVVGYTCYYQNSKAVKCSDCVKFEVKK